MHGLLVLFNNVESVCVCGERDRERERERPTDRLTECMLEYESMRE